MTPERPEAAGQPMPRRAPDKPNACYVPSLIPGLYCVTLADGGPPRVRIHDRHVFFALTAGQALVRCRGEQVLLNPSGVLMIEPGDVHRDVWKTPYRAVMVTVSAELFAALRGAKDRQVIGSAFVASLALRSALDALIAAVLRKDALAVQERRLAALFDALAPLWTQERRVPEPALVARARRALAEAPGAIVSLDELAGRLGCAPTYLCRMYSEHVGLGPHAHQLHIRLLEARRLVERGETVATAAQRTSFGDESHLSRHFRRRFAAAPGRLRQELTGA